jgi:hypothetical protein
VYPLFRQLRPAMAFLPTKYEFSSYIRKNLCGRKISRRMRPDCLLHRLPDTARGHVCCEDSRPAFVVVDTVATPAPLASHPTKPLTIHQSLQKLLFKAMLETMDMGSLFSHLKILGLSVAVLRMRTKLMMRLFPKILRLLLKQGEPAKLHKRH